MVIYILYTSKANYGLNAQVCVEFYFCSIFILQLQIIHWQYSFKFTHCRLIHMGILETAYDAVAFESTAAAKHPDWFFEGEEFAWCDSAYALSPRTIPIHKKPAALRPKNAIFDKTVSHLCVHSEHCMGALKGRFQCLWGLRININSNKDHAEAYRWITIAIILQ